MRKFKHIPTGKEWTSTYELSDYLYCVGAPSTLPIWITENSKDWEEIKEKEWEITSFIGDNGHIYHKANNLFTPSRYTAEEMMDRTKCAMKIHSVKRLSDGEVFTVGDYVVTAEDYENCKTRFNINRFEIKDDKILVYQTSNQTHCIPYLSNIQKVKKPLFTTEDGVQIFEGDTIFSVEHTYYKIYDKIAGKYKSSNANHPVEYWYNDDKYFSTKEKAEEYILLNKPCLSINDVLALSGCAYTTFEQDSFATTVKKYLKNKK
jgi:hypothetical protein